MRFSEERPQGAEIKIETAYLHMQYLTSKSIPSCWDWWLTVTASLG